MMKMARIVYRPLPPECEYEDPTPEEIREYLDAQKVLENLAGWLSKHNSLYARLRNPPNLPEKLFEKYLEKKYLSVAHSEEGSTVLDNPSYDWTNVAFMKDASK